MAFWKKKVESLGKARNWYEDKYQTTLVQRNFFAVISLVALVLAAVSVFTVQQLAPLKSVEPFVIQVDEKSGITEVVEPLSKKDLGSASEAIDNFFVWQYVRARETYDITDNRANRDIVRVMSHPDVYRRYLQEASPSNPQSFQSRLGQIGQRVASAPVVTYIKEKNKKVAQVRFVVSERIRSEAPFVYYKIATLEYDYAELKLKRDETFINPLGFQTLSYRIDDATVNR